MMLKTMPTLSEQGLQNSRTSSSFSAKTTQFSENRVTGEGCSLEVRLLDSFVRSDKLLSLMSQNSRTSSSFSAKTTQFSENRVTGKGCSSEMRLFDILLSYMLAAGAVSFIQNGAFSNKEIPYELVAENQKNRTSSRDIFVSSLPDEQNSVIEWNIIPYREAIIRAEISEYRKLPYDFDGDNGHAPDEKDITNAMSFIRHIPDAGLAAVRTMVAGDGEVGFEWKEPKKHYLEIAFSEGEISFFGDMPNGERISDGAGYDKDAIPEKLQHLLRAIFSG